MKIGTITNPCLSMAPGKPIKKVDEIAHIKSLGWSQQAAAAQLGVTYETLNRVLNGHRESRRLLESIQHLPARNTHHAA